MHPGVEEAELPSLLPVELGSPEIPGALETSLEEDSVEEASLEEDSVELIRELGSPAMDDSAEEDSIEETPLEEDSAELTREELDMRLDTEDILIEPL